MIRLNQIGSLENFQMFVRLLQTIMGNEDLTITVCDQEKLIEYIPGKAIPLPVKTGMELDERWGISKAMKKRKIIDVIVPKDVLGVVYRAVCTPILNEEGTAVGCIGITSSLDRQHQLMEMAENISTSLSEVSIA